MPVTVPKVPVTEPAETSVAELPSGGVVPSPARASVPASDAAPVADTEAEPNFEPAATLVVPAASCVYAPVTASFPLSCTVPALSTEPGPIASVMPGSTLIVPPALSTVPEIVRPASALYCEALMVPWLVTASPAGTVSVAFPGGQKVLPVDRRTMVPPLVKLPVALTVASTGLPQVPHSTSSAPGCPAPDQDECHRSWRRC